MNGGVPSNTIERKREQWGLPRWAVIAGTSGGTCGRWRDAGKEGGKGAGGESSEVVSLALAGPMLRGEETFWESFLGIRLRR